MAHRPDQTIVRVEDAPTVLIPDPRSRTTTTSPRTVPGVTARRTALRDRVPWPIPVAVGAVVLVVVAAFGLTMYEGRDRATNDVPLIGNPAAPATTIEAPPAAPNAELAAGTAGAFTSTIRVANDEDLLAALEADPGAAARLGGAPVNGDAVIVQQVFGADAFSVASSDGALPVVIYLPGATDELQGFIPGTRVLFVGTLQQTPPDLGTFLGPEIASIAGRSGAYVVAVPETVMQITPPTA